MNAQIERQIVTGLRELDDFRLQEVLDFIRFLASHRKPEIPRKKTLEKEKLLEIARHCAALPVLDSRSADELVGYDEHGLPG